MLNLIEVECHGKFATNFYFGDMRAVFGFRCGSSANFAIEILYKNSAIKVRRKLSRIYILMRGKSITNGASFASSVPKYAFMRIALEPIQVRLHSK